jgi:RHS repeat-associated protein
LIAKRCERPKKLGPQPARRRAGGLVGRGISRPRSLLAAIAALSAMALLVPLPAQASPLPEIELRHMSEIEQWVYRNGAVTSPLPCGAVCANLWRLEHDSQPEATVEAWDGLGGLETSTELWGALGELAALLGTPELKPGAFEIGWHIAGADKWLDVGVNATAAPEMVGCSVPAVGLMPPGHAFGPTYHETVVLAQWAYVLTDNACGSWNEIEADTNEPEAGSCKPIGENISPGPEWNPASWWWNENFCGNNEKGEPLYAKLIAHGWYAPFHFARPEDWTGQNLGTGHNVFTNSAHDPGATAVRAATEASLNASAPLGKWVQEALERSVGSPEEEYGPGDASAPNEPKCMTDKPVNCATGNEVLAQTDLTVGGLGPGLRLTRTYNAQLAAKQTSPGPLGYGWTGSYSAHVEIAEEGNVATVHLDDGAAETFLRSGEVWGAANPLVQATLASEGSALRYTLPDQTVLRFDGAGRLSSETDRNANALTMSRNGEGRLESVSDPAGRKLTFAYSGGFLESAKDPMGHTVKYAYEGGDLASVTLPGQVSPRWQFKYDASHRLTKATDGRGATTTNEYDSSNRVISQTDPAERITSFEYWPSETRITNKATGAVTRETFSLSNEPLSVTRGYGTASASTEEFAYDSAGNRVSATDANKHTTKFGYDGEGDKTSVLDADEHETKWSYDSTHDAISTTTPKGETTTITRDSHGNPEVIERPAPAGKTQITKDKFNSLGELVSTTDPLERTTKYEYDAQGDRTGEIDPEGDKRTWSYDEGSRVSSSVSPRGNVEGGEASKYTTKVERDAQGRPLLVTDPLGHKTKHAYDANGNLESLTDPNGHKTKYTYDADNERTKVEQPNGTSTETSYDGAGQVVSQTDGNKHSTKYTRNVLEQVTEVIDPLARKSTKEYDSAGNLTKLTDPAKRTTTNTYDPTNKLKETTYSDGKTHSVKYEYDADSDRTSMIDATGTTSDTYDQLDRLSETKDGHGDLVKYEYDLANQQTKITYPNAKAITQTFDKAGRLQKVTDWLEHATKFAYSPDSQQTSTTFPTGTSNEDKYTYDEADQLGEAKMLKGAETLASLAYTRDSDGQLKGITSKGLPGEEKPSYEYDANNRLSKGATIAYEYDAADNPTKTGASTNTYDIADELKTATGNTYSYDELGERSKRTPTSGAATTYGYDQAQHLTSLERPKEGKVAAIADSYAYDGSGLRSSQTISGTSTFLAWDMSKALPLILNDGSNSYIYGPGGLPVEQISSGGTVLYLHHDQQGSTRMLTSSTGKAEATMTFDAYGNKTGSTGTATSPLGYDGQYTSSDTGLIYLRARTYDPATAQFLSVDPAEPITRAPYTYAKDNPLNLSDPSGLSVLGSFESVGETLLHAGLDVAAVPPYAIYYGSYELARGINSLGREFGLPGEVASHLAALPLTELEALGLSGDALLDWIKGHTVNSESICDEGPGFVARLNPLHQYLPIPGEPAIQNPPGIHSNGEVDFEW